MYKASRHSLLTTYDFVFCPRAAAPRSYCKRPYKNLSGTNMYIHYKMYNIIILCIYNHNINLINNREKYIIILYWCYGVCLRVTLERPSTSACVVLFVIMYFNLKNILHFIY